MVRVMSPAQTPAGRAAAWSHELPQLLAACGPLAAISAAALLRAAGHIVTDEEVEQELSARLDIHEIDDGWVSAPVTAGLSVSSPG